MLGRLKSTEFPSTWTHCSTNLKKSGYQPWFSVLLLPEETLTQLKTHNLNHSHLLQQPTHEETPNLSIQKILPIAASV